MQAVKFIEFDEEDDQKHIFIWLYIHIQVNPHSINIYVLLHFEHENDVTIIDKLL